MIGANSTVAKYCAELKMAEAVPRSLAGKPGGDDPAVGREGRRLGEPDQEAQHEQHVNADRPRDSPTQPCRSVNSDQMKMLQK